MIILFEDLLSRSQVAAMDQDQVEQQVVTFDAAAVAADEMGGRESVKNSFQCNECFKVSGWASSGDQTGFYTGNEIKDVWEMDYSAEFQLIFA